jgi:ParB family transcriptional regulator, chromosome partitioning protein
MGKPSLANLTMRNTGALIPGSSKLTELQSIAVNAPSDRVDPRILVPSPYQPRTAYPEDEMEELEESINSAGGIKIPLIVRPSINEIISGGRRQIIALKRGDVFVPVYWHSCSDREAEELAAFENVKRSDLNPIDETNMVVNMVKLRLDLPDRQSAIDLIQSIYFQMRSKSELDRNNVITQQVIQSTIETIRQFTKGRLQLGTFVANKLRLLNLPEDITEAITNGLEYTKAVAISKVQDPEQRSDLLRCVADEGMPLTEIKKQVKSFTPEREKKNPTPKDRVRSTLSQVSKAKISEVQWLELEVLLEKIELILKKEAEENEGLK